jgi:alpha-L-arabinofuranosidase
MNNKTRRATALFGIFFSALVPALSLAKSQANTNVDQSNIIYINDSVDKGKVRSNLIGTNILYWVNKKDQIKKDGGGLDKFLKEHKVMQLRFPGGTVANNFNWKTNRLENAHEFPFEIDKETGKMLSQEKLDERSDYLDFLSLRDRVGADANFVVNLSGGRESAGLNVDNENVPRGPAKILKGRFYKELNKAEKEEYTKSVDYYIKLATGWVCAVNGGNGCKLNEKKYKGNKKVINWELGNELYFCGNEAGFQAEDYANLVVKFSDAMKKIDSDIKIGAIGPFGLKRNDTKGSGFKKECGEETYSWWDVLSKKAKGKLDFIVLHRYDPTRVGGEKSNEINFEKNVIIKETISSIRTLVEKNNGKAVDVAMTEYNIAGEAEKFSTHQLALVQAEQFLHLIQANVDFANFWPLTFGDKSQVVVTSIKEGDVKNYTFEARPISKIYKEIASVLGTHRISHEITENVKNVDFVALVERNNKSEIKRTTILMINRNAVNLPMKVKGFKGKNRQRAIQFISSAEGESVQKSLNPYLNSKDLVLNFNAAPYSLTIINYDN